ncbi:N-formimino-L-glutamate deiminase [Hoeflea sp. BAL378]|uniref:formimidoylglutamate deiminase n=1 Tax=Hoeflea sp. BAL378 TaxID=1547437 RepID=UPI000513256F|nr:formimidoylglutamate deiminase [Hoeflea sp. BAL378]KGF67921.1 N-formimino-L-glutamate deiminase [Hoeflea sp. BAL378]
MTILWAEKALLEDGWAENVRIGIAGDGRIASVEPGQPAEGVRTGILLPSPVNCHSHAFQRAMAGLTERRGPDASDSFWTWRQLMFRFLDRLTPDHVEAIAGFVQMEMLEAGYSTNVEFHYLHHRPGGAPYDDIAEMAERIAAASVKSGIGLTLLPVHYQYGGCDRRPLGPGQIRFGNTFDDYARLHERSAAIVARLSPDCAIGVAPHSLRAVAPEDLPHHARLAGDTPLHMHLAEQIAEVEEVLAHHGRRPVEWVLDNLELNDRRCFIHCTQMLPHETEGLARSGAVAGLCPITESSLGDGIFDGVRWLKNGGAIAVGSDSNIRISLTEELRTLDHSQRLRDHSRAALATPEKSTGRRLFDAVTAGGASVAGRDTGAIAVGKLADLMALDAQSVDLAGRSGDTLIDCLVFAGDDRMISDVWSAGRHMVTSGRHVKREAIVSAYAKAMRELGEAI